MARSVGLGALVAFLLPQLACSEEPTRALARDAGHEEGKTLGHDASPDVVGDAGERFHVLLFTRTYGHYHESIPAAVAALTELGATGGYVAEATDDAAAFTADNLARFQVVVFLLTSGEIVNAEQQAAFEAWMTAGRGWVGVHSASDTEYNWPFYGSLVGAYFLKHPGVQQATLILENPSHPVLAGLPSPWVWVDEWYDFRTNPRGKVTVLATVDESSYAGGSMGSDHPITWAHDTRGGGRAFYTAMGHPAWVYSAPDFRRMLVQAIRWVAKR